MVKRRTLVLCVDRDNDLGAKAGISGPVVGREENVAAATKLALADPEETDANTMFEAVRVYDQLAKEQEAQVATLTGSERLGYAADREVLKQLERVLTEFSCDSCIFVSDGESDAQVIPLIQNVVKVESVRVVVMKQAKELEKTYFVLLEKLKEPHYARLVFGIPAVLLLLIVAGDLAGYSGWRIAVLALGGYLLAKGFGIEEAALNYISNFRISMENVGALLYLSAFPLLIVAIAMAYEGYTAMNAQTGDGLKVAAYALSRPLPILLLAGFLMLTGKGFDVWSEKRKYDLVRYGVYGVFGLVIWLIFSVAADWVLAKAYFSDFVLTMAYGVVLVALAVRVLDWVRLHVAEKMKLEGKEVLTDLGAYIGKAVGVDRRKGVLIVQTSFGQKLDMPFERIASIGEKKVVVRY